MKEQNITTEKDHITVVALGDIHAGSKRAIALPEQDLCGGGKFSASEQQLELYGMWRRLTEQWANPDILIVNGDAVEGQARKENGTGNWSNDFDDQLECARQLIAMWHAKKIFITEGTGYHVDAGGKSLEHHLGKLVEAEQTKDEQYAHEQVFIRAAGKVIHAAHHISVGTGWYKATPLSRELVFALLNESSIHKVDVVLRSHVHYFCGVEFHRQRGYTLPCWQLTTRYMLKKSAFGMLPSLGAVRFRLYEDEIRMDKALLKIESARPELIEC
jgi:3',5'-cyclic AMP phosphodiesterase CpdA